MLGQWAGLLPVLPGRVSAVWVRPHEKTVLLAPVRLPVPEQDAPMRLTLKRGDGKLEPGWRHVNIRQPRQDDGLRPEAALALEVVCVAIHDIHRGSKRRYVRESDQAYAVRHEDACDAQDFLLRRINEDDNCWGAVLRQWGMRPLTQDRLAWLVRNRAFLTLDQFLAA